MGVCTPAAVYLYLDKKSVPSDEADIVLAVEVQTAADANVADGTPVVFNISDGSNSKDIQATTRRGVATASVPLSPTVARYQVVAHAGAVSTPAQIFEVVPGPPHQFSMAMGPCRQGGSCRIETSIIKDRFGNQIETGVQGSLRTYVGGALVQQQTVQSLSGRVRADWTRPAQPARVELVMGGASALVWVAGQ